MRQIADPACMAAPCAAPAVLAAPCGGTGRSLELGPVRKGLNRRSAFANQSFNATGRQWLDLHLPGLIACAIVAVAATSLSEHYGASAMLYALLLGMAVNFLSAEGRCVVGVAFTARSVLRIGVALLGKIGRAHV